MEHRELLEGTTTSTSSAARSATTPSRSSVPPRAIDGKGLRGHREDSALRRLDTRTLIVWGEEDPYDSVEHAERLGEVLPARPWRCCPGCSTS